ncbi:MAG TPA: NlpC/P60 family protein [Mycobacteriales bacterium]
MPTEPTVAPAGSRRRRLLVVVVAALAAVPASLLLTGSSQAAPTLTIAEAQAQISALQVKEDAAVEAYDAGQIAATQAAQRSQKATANVRAQTARLNAMYAGIRSFAVATYTGGNVDSIDTILAGANPSTAIRKAGMLDEIARAHQSQLLAIHAQQVSLTAAQTTAKSQAAVAAQKVTELAAAKDQIQKLIGQQQAVLAHLQAQQRAALLAQQRAEQAAAAAAAKAAAERLASERAARARTVEPVAMTASASASSSASGPSSGGGGSPTPVHASGNAGQIALQWAETQMGKPYVYGGAGPNAYDCSGLTMRAFQQAGISLPHSAAGQYGYGTHVSASQLQPGDLVFYREDGTIGHVGIYVGNGQMIDANHTGGWVGIRGLYSGLIGGTRL